MNSTAEIIKIAKENGTHLNILEKDYIYCTAPINKINKSVKLR
jgi:hypothetical protein